MKNALPRVSAAEAVSALEWLRTRNVAVLGYGAQGHAHAQNLRDSGLRVIVGQRSGRRCDQAVSDGFRPVSVAEATKVGDLLILGLPDETIPEVFRTEIAPNLRPDATIGFLHGFVMHYRLIEVPATCGAALVAPKAQGHGVRSEFVAGRGPAALIAVAHNGNGLARQAALGWAAGIGAHRALILETTFRDETETDLFGEQAVLCGGLTALIRAGFETLVEAGYPPELAYFECCHEVKLLADLIQRHGFEGMRSRISTTARYGDITRGRRVIDDRVRQEMRRVLGEVQSGEFAREFLSTPRPADPDRTTPIETVGAELRRSLFPDQK